MKTHQKNIHFLISALALSFGAVTGAQAQSPLGGFDTHSLSGGGGATLAPSAVVSGVTFGNLTKGSGVVTGTGLAARAFGGTGFTSTDAATAATNGQDFTFTLTANMDGVNLTSFDQFNYRRSGTGPASGLLEYQIGNGAFETASTLSFTNTAGSGANLAPIALPADLTGLTNGTVVTFRIDAYGASSASGTFYIFDVASTTANDLDISGTVPEPTTVLGGALMIGAAAWSQRRRLLAAFTV